MFSKKIIIVFSCTPNYNFEVRSSNFLLRTAIFEEGETVLENIRNEEVRNFLATPKIFAKEIILNEK